MPFTVITLTNVPNSVRGDLSKWMQEIAVGVYVGNFNSRIREQLWQRVCENLKNGEATLSYAARNEIGYAFDSYQTKQEVIDVGGIPLVRYPTHSRKSGREEKYGFSKAYHSHLIHKLEKRGDKKGKADNIPLLPAYILMDLETTGLDEEKNQVIEIGAIKVIGNQKEEFHRLIQVDTELPTFVTELTGLTNHMLLTKGGGRRKAMEDFADFVGEMPLVGYNIKFDIKFLEREFLKLGFNWKAKGYVDILSLVRKEKLFLDNYKLSTVLVSYGIDTAVPHRALDDAKLLAKLLPKLKEFETELRRKG